MDKSLTLVDLPFIDALYAKTARVDVHTRRAHAVSYLENRMVWYAEHTLVGFTEAEINEVLGKVTFMSRNEYRASVPYDQYLAETRVRTHDWF